MADTVSGKWLYSGPFIKIKRGAQASSGGKHSGGATRAGRQRTCATVRRGLVAYARTKNFSVWDGIS